MLKNDILKLNQFLYRKMNIPQVKYVKLPFKNKVCSVVFVSYCLGFDGFNETTTV